MPVQYPNARIPFGDVAQAIEDQLVLDVVVEDRAQITWGTPDNIPQFTGPADLLLICRNATHTSYDGGAAQQPLERLVDLWWRSQAVADPGGGFKSWIKSVFVAGDKILDSVGNDMFWPHDIDGNDLTVESIKLVGDAAPDYPKKNAVFGDYVGTLSCKYFPAINPNKGAPS